MKIQRGLHRPTPATGSALTIGNFDGVHRGHQAMLTLLKEEAHRRGLPVCVVTFEPHPRDYFARVRRQPDLAPARITALRDKMDALAALGIDRAVILPFQARLAALPPQQFVQQVLLDGLGARYVLVGDDFRFGAQRAGDLPLLQAMARVHGFEVGCMQEQAVQGLRVSSTAVREALQRGDMQAVATLLGRPYAISVMWCTDANSGAAYRRPRSTCALRTGNLPPAAFFACRCMALLLTAARCLVWPIWVFALRWIPAM